MDNLGESAMWETNFLRTIRALACIIILLQFSGYVISDHENLTEAHYRPGAGELPVEKRYEFLRAQNGSGSLSTPSPSTSTNETDDSSKKPDKISYLTIACYPDQKDLVHDDPLLCEDGCKVTDTDQSDCGPQYYKLYCDCSGEE